MILNNKKRNIFGFTLIETMVVISIFTILSLGATLLMKNIIKSTRQNNFSLENADKTRYAAFNFTNEIRSASIGVDGAYPITQAGDNQITFYSSYGNKDGLVNKIRYFISDGELKKGIIEPSGTPLSYSSLNEKVVTVTNDLQNGDTPLFYYYDSDYNGDSYPLIQPVNINLIRYVKINMIILKQTEEYSNNTFTVNSGAAIRNLKTNLEN